MVECTSPKRISEYEFIIQKLEVQRTVDWIPAKPS